jgi:hypothetical protein
MRGGMGTKLFVLVVHGNRTVLVKIVPTTRETADLFRKIQVHPYFAGLILNLVPTPKHGKKVDL